MIANLYTRYCNRKDDNGDECSEDDDKFTVLPVFGFFIMVAWVSDVNIEYSYVHAWSTSYVKLYPMAIQEQNHI